MRFRTLCPAKINLSLNVFSPDSSGFHPIKTEFQAVSLCDELSIEIGKKNIDVDGAVLPKLNTVSKTLNLISDVIALPDLSIQLKKRIPSEAGLGGGSSDAAGLIRLLRAMFPGEISDHQALDIACAVGADVPFFLNGGRALGTHYGEMITQLEDLPRQILILAQPAIGCSTPLAYKSLDLTRAMETPLPQILPEFEGRIAENDFLITAPKESIQLLKDVLSCGAFKAGLCGSGSCIFGFFDSRAQADKCLTMLSGARFKGIYSTLGTSDCIAITANP